MVLKVLLAGLVLALGGGAAVAAGLTGFHGFDFDGSLVVIGFQWVCLPVMAIAGLVGLVRRRWTEVAAVPFAGVAAYSITVTGGTLDSIFSGRHEHDGFLAIAVLYLSLATMSAHAAWYIARGALVCSDG